MARNDIVMQLIQNCILPRCVYTASGIFFFQFF